MDKTPGILQKIKVKSAKINRLEKKVTVEISSETYISLEEEKRLAEHFKSHFDTDNLGIVCSVKNAVLGDIEKKDIIDRMIDHCPTLMPYREKISLEQTESSLILSFPDVCEKLMGATGSIRHIAEFLSKGLKFESELVCRPVEGGNGKEEFTRIKNELSARNSSENEHIIKEYSKPVKKPEKVNKYGKSRSYTEVKLNEITNEFERVAFDCEIIDVESNLTKSGKTLYKFDVTDYTSSITCKVFSEGNEARELKKILQPGECVRVEGKYGYDTYDTQNIIMAKRISQCEPLHSSRLDSAEEKRVELHLHTKMSSKDGFIEPGHLFRTLKEWGHTSVAITDHGVVQAFPEAFECAKKNGIKPIFGVEGYLVDDGRAFINNPDDNEITIGMYIVLKGEEWEVQRGEEHFYIKSEDYLAVLDFYKGGTILTSIELKQLPDNLPVLDYSRLYSKLGNAGLNLSEVYSPEETDNTQKLIEAWGSLLQKPFMDGIKTTNELCIFTAGKSINRNMKQYHVIVLAKNKAGLKSLYELISYSHINFFYKKPRIPKSILDSKRKNLIIGSACEAGEMYTAVVNGDSEARS